MPTVFDIPFDAGMHQDTDPGLARTGVVTRILNGRVPRQGGIVKRLGRSSVSTTVEGSGGSQAVPTSTPNACARPRNRDVLVIGGRAYQRDGATTPSWTETGRAGRYLPRRAHFIALDETVKGASVLGATEPPHVAAMAGFVCIVYTETEDTDAQVIALVMDSAGVRRLSWKSTPSGGNGHRHARVVTVGTKFVVCYMDEWGIAGDFFMRVIDPAASTIGAEITIAARGGFDATDIYAVNAWNDTSFLFVARTSTIEYTARQVDLTGATLDSAAWATAADDQYNLTIYGTPGQYIFVAWRDDGGVAAEGRVLPADFSSSTGFSFGGTGATGPRFFGFTRRNSTSAWLAYSDERVDGGLAVSEEGVVVTTVSSAGAVSAPDKIFWQMRIASDPFDGDSDEDKVSLWVFSNGKTPRTVLGQTFTNRSWCCTFCIDPAATAIEWVNVELSSERRPDITLQTTGIAPAFFALGPVASVGHLRYFVQFELLGERPALILNEFEDTSTRRGAWRQVLGIPGGTVIAGGHLQELQSDRRNPDIVQTTSRGFENGWVRGPWQESIAFPAGTFPDGLYLYGILYSYIDVDGRRRRSEIDFGTVTVAGGPKGITFRLTTPLATEHEISTDQQREAVEIYISSEPNGSTLYRATPDVGATVALQPPGGSQPYNLIEVTLTDPPATTNEFIYTTGGVLQNAPAPSHRYALSSDSRLHLAGLWDPRVTEVSKFINDNEPAQFTQANQFRVRWPIDVSALAELDGLTLALGVGGLATVPSIWPDKRGFPGAGEPTLLSTTGLRDEDAVVSVVRIPSGVLFQGERGIYLVPRGGGEPEFIGAPIQSDSFTVTSAAAFSELADAHAPPSRLVAFTIRDANGIEYIAVLDQDTLQWVSLDDTAAFSGECQLGSFGRDLILMPQSLVADDIERSGAARAGTSTVVCETAWCRPFGLLRSGYVRRVQLALTCLDLLPVQLQFARDGSDYFTLPEITPPALGLQRIEWQLSGDQLTTACRFRVISNPNNLAGIGAILHGLSVEVDAVEGIARIPAGART